MSSTCTPTLQNTAFYLQGVSIETFQLSYDYFVTGTLPSSAADRRVWQFISQGHIYGQNNAILNLDYQAAQEKCPEIQITFSGPLNGNLIFYNQVFSAKKYMSFRSFGYIAIISIKIPRSVLECHGANAFHPYFFNVNVDDAAVSSDYYLTYGQDSSGYGYTYTAGPPDILNSTQSYQNFLWNAISDGDVVSYSCTSNSINNNSLYYYEVSGASVTISSPLEEPCHGLQLIYFPTQTTNWGIYWDYASNERMSGAYLYFFDGRNTQNIEVVLPAISKRDTFVYRIEGIFFAPLIYLVVANIAINEKLTIVQKPSVITQDFTQCAIYLYDTSGAFLQVNQSAYPYTTTVCYDVSGWSTAC